ncbi:MAG: hypothetical protein QGM50_06715 [Anaerolineae bacterium]|nr:hypothetical protein [Anaerolineae bacterium]MDK1118470.1 hypothetical protein [Anaerolineae bacterium]
MTDLFITTGNSFAHLSQDRGETWQPITSPGEQISRILTFVAVP